MNSEQNNDINQGKSANSSRRKFLQKASAGVALTTIPAKSVWASGCGTISGQLSGNLSTQTCADPLAKFDGRSGGFWKYLNPGKVKSAFSTILSHGDANSIAIPHINLSKAQTFGTIFGTLDSRTLAEVLESGGINKQLTSAYLNAKYEFYKLPDGVNAEAYAASLWEQVYGVAPTATVGEMSEAIKATHLDGTSDFVF